MSGWRQFSKKKKRKVRNYTHARQNDTTTRVAQQLKLHTPLVLSMSWILAMSRKAGASLGKYKLPDLKTEAVRFAWMTSSGCKLKLLL